MTNFSIDRPPYTRVEENGKFSLWKRPKGAVSQEYTIVLFDHALYVFGMKEAEEATARLMFLTFIRGYERARSEVAKTLRSLMKD